ncbi:hypothetical protein [Mycoplasma sp. 'Moose RK']|uniref:hypothetical protein n=1 Tax=Mycoplasma sp. 'Moose RK' TaxID=2780095 RepID=UPI0018C2EFE1|nr:hypothetical protein [Mycoplasma sp. 'Moose RK']MBG0730900.1 hypothetical protein [Mycoplasma sp. 'Moose RK']
MLVVTIAVISGFSFLAYKIESYLAPEEEISITILKGVRNPGTIFFKPGTSLREIFAKFEVIRGIDIEKFNLDSKITSDQTIELKLPAEKIPLSKMTIFYAKKLKIERETVAKIRNLIKEEGKSGLTWTNLKWKLKLDSAIVKVLQENFTLD